MDGKVQKCKQLMWLVRGLPYRVPTISADQRFFFLFYAFLGFQFPNLEEPGITK